MSKVVHLSNDAHAKAKMFCKSHGLKMSDWVGTLIFKAIHSEEVSNNREVKVATPLPKKKKLPKMEEDVVDGTPIYAKPPFWASNSVSISNEESNQAVDF